jgi:hypothetical protein
MQFHNTQQRGTAKNAKSEKIAMTAPVVLTDNGETMEFLLPADVAANVSDGSLLVCSCTPCTLCFFAVQLHTSHPITPPACRRRGKRMLRGSCVL